MENEIRYIHFPLFLISQLFAADKYTNAISNIFDVGIYKYSNQFKVDDLSAYRQVIYSFYRGGLTSNLQNFLQNCYDNDTLTLDDDYNGFNGDSFDPFELDELCELGATNKILRDQCIEFLKMKLALDSLKISGSIERILDSAKAVNQLINKHEAVYGKEPSVMLKTELIFDYYQKNKSINDIILFATYAGIKSIIGKKDFAGTTKKMIVGRMIGAKSDKVLQDFLKNKKLKAVHAKYFKRYWFKKLIDQLLVRGFVKSKISTSMGLKSRMYLSCILDYDELPLAIAAFWNNMTGTKKLKELKVKEKMALKQIKALITSP
jgi:hypothetical protein